MKHFTVVPARLMAWSLLLVGVVLLSSCGRQAGIETHSLDGVAVIDLAAPENQLARLEKIEQQGGLEEPLILKIPAGHRLPVQLTMDAPFAALSSSDNYLEFKRDVFVLVSSASMMLSPDAVRWAAVEDMDAIKELFGLAGGEVTIGMSATEQQGALLQAGVVLRPK